MAISSISPYLSSFSTVASSTASNNSSTGSTAKSGSPSSVCPKGNFACIQCGSCSSGSDDLVSSAGNISNQQYADTSLLNTINTAVVKASIADL